MTTTKYFCERCGSDLIAVIQNGYTVRAICQECCYTKYAIGDDTMFNEKYHTLKPSNILQLIEDVLNDQFMLAQKKSKQEVLQC